MAGAWLDGAGRARRPELVGRARALGADFPEDWAELEGRRLLKLALARTEGAQIRTNPIARDESFACVHCAGDVPKGGRRPRDHCPFCLYSVHVDVVPGDRAASCAGLLVPVQVVASAKGAMIQYRCVRCGAERRNRVLDDLAVPDDPAALRGLTR
ncbi:MAG: RNHCP domain-containing protein [Myxococcales bacterium]|nr:RNHCP domain-containing protein [Myxococcales bacterium]